MKYQIMKSKACDRKDSAEDFAEKGLLSQTEVNNESSCYFPIRLLVAILAGFGVFNTNTLRLNISLALVAMVNESALLVNVTSTSDSRVCGAREEIKLTNLTMTPTTSEHTKDGPFVWDEATRGIILSAYFWGNVFGQIPGGILADRFGGKWSFGIGILVSALVTLLVPTAAYYDVTLVIVLRVLCGVSQGMALPALYSLLVHWVPHEEKSRLTGLTYSGVSLGKVVVFPIAGILCDSAFLGGWPAVFYVFGAFGIVWFFAWAFLVYDSPSEDPKVGKKELLYIEDHVSEDTKTRKHKVNWKRLITCGPLWALFLAYFAQSWGAQILLTILPSYLKFAMNFDMKSSGMVNGLPHILAVVASLAGSCIADMMQNSKLISSTNSRKLFAALAMYIPMWCLFGVTFLECDRVALIILLTTSVTLAAVNSGGLFINEMDLSMKLAGTLKGMTNFASNLAGVIAPYAAGILVENNESLDDWNKVFLLSSAILFVGATVYMIFGSADDQRFCEFDDDSDSAPIVSENNNYRQYGTGSNPDQVDQQEQN